MDTGAKNIIGRNHVLFRPLLINVVGPRLLEVFSVLMLITANFHHMNLASVWFFYSRTLKNKPGSSSQNKRNLEWNAVDGWHSRSSRRILNLFVVPVSIASTRGLQYTRCLNLSSFNFMAVAAKID